MPEATRIDNIVISKFERIAKSFCYDPVSGKLEIRIGRSSMFCPDYLVYPILSK